MPETIQKLKALDEVEQASFFHGRERRRSFNGVPDLYRSLFISPPDKPFNVNRFSKSDAPATFHTAIRITGPAPAGNVFELGNATTAFVIWVGNNTITARMGDEGDDAAIATFDNGGVLPDTKFIDITACMRPGDGRIRLYLNGFEAARATAVNGQLPNGTAAQSNGSFADSAQGPLMADVLETGAPTDFEVIDFGSFYSGVVRHFV